jgi:hypothetical protein
MSKDRLFLHEFLYLLCNTKNRNEMYSKVPGAEFTIEKKSIKKYEMQPLDAKRLDKIFNLDLSVEIGKKHKDKL